MKLFKKIVSLILLFSFYFVDAKRTGTAIAPSFAKATADTQPQPTPPPILQPISPQKPSSSFASSSREASHSAKASKNTSTGLRKAPADRQPRTARPAQQQAAPAQPKTFTKPTERTRQAPTPSPLPMKPAQPSLPRPVAPVRHSFSDEGQATSNYSITNNVVVALDPRKKETVQTAAESLVQQSLVALYQKAAPVIMTNNILEIILTVKQRIGDQNLQQLRNMDGQQLFNYAAQFAQKVGIPGIQQITIILLSGIDFNSINFY